MELARQRCLRSIGPKGRVGSNPTWATKHFWRYAGAWLIGPVLKTVGEKSHEGSNPSTSSNIVL